MISVLLHAMSLVQHGLGKLHLCIAVYMLLNPAADIATALASTYMVSRQRSELHQQLKCTSQDRLSDTRCGQHRSHRVCVCQNSDPGLTSTYVSCRRRTVMHTRAATFHQAADQEQTKGLQLHCNIEGCEC